MITAPPTCLTMARCVSWAVRYASAASTLTSRRKSSVFFSCRRRAHVSCFHNFVRLAQL